MGVPNSILELFFIQEHNSLPLVLLLLLDAPLLPFFPQRKFFLEFLLMVFAKEIHMRVILILLLHLLHQDFYLQFLVEQHTSVDASFTWGVLRAVFSHPAH